MSAVDVRAVMREVEEEARRLRQSPDFPADLAAQLDAVAARFLPVQAAGDDLAQAVSVLEQRAYIDVNAPTFSRVAPFAVLKKVLKKLLAWYFRYVAQQVTTFGNAVARLGSMLSERVERVEADRDEQAARIEALEARVRELEARLGAPPPQA